MRNALLASTSREPAIEPPREERAAAVVQEAAGESSVPAAGPAPWGWFPAITLVSAIGLLTVSVAYAGARSVSSWSEPLFWIGLLVIFLPGAARLSLASPSRLERIAIIAVLGLALYAVKVLHSPLTFTYFDEAAHFRTAADVQQAGRLFVENPMLVVSPLYPGLEILTTALANLSGLTIFAAGVVVVGAARLVLVLTLYLVYERASGSAWVAGIASLVYMSNPPFLFFDAQFAYESLALPLAALVLLAIARRTQGGPRGRVALTVAAFVALGALVVTHHITAYSLVAFLAIWTLISSHPAFLPSRLVQGHRYLVRWYGGNTRSRQAGEGARPRVRPLPSPLLGSGLVHHQQHGWMTLLALVAVLSWLVYAAVLTVGYLAPNLVAGVRELILLISGQGAARELFRTHAGQLAPLWERMLGFGSVALIILGLPPAFLVIWHKYRTSTLALTLAIASSLYPAILALRLTQRGSEISIRLAGLLFVAVAFALSVAVVRSVSPMRYSRARNSAFVVWMAVLFLGGVTVGRAPWMRLPGPYLVGADTRSVEPQGLAAAEWARTFLGPGNRIGTDRTNQMLMAAYGGQNPLSGYRNSVNVARVFFSPEVGAEERNILRAGRIQYLVVDRRLSSGLPLAGVYFERGEPDTFNHRTPLDPARLAKFDRLPDVSRVFDSGDISILDLGVLSGAP